MNPIRRFKTDGGFTSIFRTIGFIGDSLSSGEYESLTNGKKDYHDYYEYSWGQFIARKCGLKAFNFSRGGMTATWFLDFSKGNEDKERDMYLEENRCQGYVIALGVNDTNMMKQNYGELGYGSIDDIDLKTGEIKRKTFLACYLKIILEVRALQPKSRIFLVSMPRVENMSKEIRGYRKRFSHDLKTIASLFEFCYVIDLWKYAPVYGKRFHERYFCGGHMSALGYKFTADMISTYIDYIIKHNSKDFTQVGFIGKEVHNESERW